MSSSEITRRGFLKAAGVVGAVGMAAPALARLARTQDKSGKAQIVVGVAPYLYEMQHDWGTLPADIAWGNTHGVAEDSKGNIYIKHTVHASSTKPDAIVVFDPDGRFVRSWGGEYKGGAHGLHLSREAGGEFLYICDQARGVVDKTTLIGEKVWSLTCPMESGLYEKTTEYHPTNVAVVPSGPRAGEFYIGDGYGRSWIHHYNAKAGYVRSFGGPGNARGQLKCPHGLMIDTRGPEPLLIVADRGNRRLQVFTLDGRHVRFVTDELRSPCHFDQREGVLLVPDLEACVTLLDRDNKLIAQLGDGGGFGLREKARAEFAPGKFIAPHGAIFDHAGNIFVVEWVEVGRVTKLKRVS
ncbi:MAG: twin-arginine translocation signal domain-containing protein [Phycisphaerales bacterium]